MNNLKIDLDGSLRGSTTPGHSGLRSNGNGNKGVLHTPKNSELKFHYQLSFRVICKISKFRGLTSLRGIQSAYFQHY